MSWYFVQVLEGDIQHWLLSSLYIQVQSLALQVVKWVWPCIMLALNTNFATIFILDNVILFFCRQQIFSQSLLHNKINKRIPYSTSAHGIPLFLLVYTGDKEEGILPVSRSCSTEIPPLNLTSSFTITSFPDIITEPPSPRMNSDSAINQATASANCGKTDDFLTLLDVTSNTSLTGHRHSKSMDGKMSFKWERERERSEECCHGDKYLYLSYYSIPGLIKPFKWLR